MVLLRMCRKKPRQGAGLGACSQQGEQDWVHHDWDQAADAAAIFNLPGRHLDTTVMETI